MTTQPQSDTSDASAFHVEKLYLKDLSFESPNAPDIFQNEQEPKVSLDMDSGSKKLNNDYFEVTLKITVKVTSNGEDKTLFLVEVSYGGIFLIRNIKDEHLPMVLGIECPTILFPYVRQVISQTTGDGGFRPMVLDPINFAFLYQQAQANRKKENATG